MENIFKNAYFGKPYKTIDNRKALFLQFDEIVNDNGNVIEKLAYVYTLQDGEYSVNIDGSSDEDKSYGYDIVAEWTEDIN